jgi:hypothetical protein
MQSKVDCMYVGLGGGVLSKPTVFINLEGI